MNGEQKFWLTVWAFILIGVLGFCGCITISSMYADYKIAAAIESGADPIEVKYALRATNLSEDAMAWITKTKLNNLQKEGAMKK